VAIKVLSPETALKIAAGEVIERPASVVKELIENSIDAKAHHIRVEIKNGGLSYLRVSDDGGGIPFAEVAVAFERHATSKINEAEDLYRLHTLGFRGEALPSIAAVSQMTLLTRPRDITNPEDGSEISIEGSRQIYHRSAGAPFGTIITVRNLFYNLPARQKWSRGGTNEASHILNILNSYALAYPEIKFTLVSENRLLLQSSGNGDLKDAIAKVYGADTAQAMLPVNLPTTDQTKNLPPVDADGVILESELEAAVDAGEFSPASTPKSPEAIQVVGYTGDPSFSKPNRNYITFFVNKRLVQSRLLTYAVQEAYQSLIMTGRFPVAVLLIELDPAQVDANVHPAKTEVRFLHERQVFAAVQKAVRTALIDHSSIPVWSVEAATPPRTSNNSASQAALAHNIYAPQPSPNSQGQLDFAASPTTAATWSTPNSSSSQNISPEVVDSSQNNEDDFDLMDEVAPSLSALKAQAEVQTQMQPPPPKVNPVGAETVTARKMPLLRVLGQMANTYVVAEGPDGIYLIDQHAAHERVMYERFQMQLAGRKLDSQLLLEPVLLDLVPRQRLALQEPNRLEELASFGFELEKVEGADTLLLSAVPASLFGRSVAASLREMLDEADGTSSSDCGGYDDSESDSLEEPAESLPRSWRDRMAASLACHSAVRAGQILTQEEMRELITQLELTQSPRACAHGRPTMVHLSQGQLEKRFGRK
jgi:DNA mismatch repair protein MutL